MCLHDCLDYWGSLQPDAEFAVQGERRIAYREAVSMVNRRANALIGAGLQAGDSVAILAKNSIEYVLLYFAASKAGITIVPLNCRLAPPEWSYVLGDARPRMLFASGHYLAAIDAMRGELATIERFVSLDVAGARGWEPIDTWALDWPSTPPPCEIDDESDVY